MRPGTDLTGRWQLRNGRYANITHKTDTGIWVGIVEGESTEDYWKYDCNHIISSAFDLVKRLPVGEAYIIGKLE